jgi:hypothetical protein
MRTNCAITQSTRGQGAQLKERLSEHHWANKGTRVDDVLVIRCTYTEIGVGRDDTICGQSV